MPSSNPRYGNWKLRQRALANVRARAAAGEPCGICRKPIDLTLPQTFIDPKDGKRKRAPWSLECDEIVPVADGGSPYDLSNVQPAHRSCNIHAGRKRNRQGIKSRRPKTSRVW